MVFDKVGRGPTVVLKESWAGEQSSSQLSKSATSCLSELKERPNRAAKEAECFAKTEQYAYADYYCGKSKEKEFKVDKKY